MFRSMEKALIFGATSFVISAAAARSEPVTVYTRAPSQLAAEAAEQRDHDKLARDFQRYQPIYARHRVQSLQYRLIVESAGMIPIPCDGVPVLVRIHRGRLISARYAETAGGCRAGHRIRRSDRWAYTDYLTPNKLNRIIESARKSKLGDDSYCVRAEFDPQSGLPVKLDGGCYLVADAYWAVVLTDVRFEP